MKCGFVIPVYRHGSTLGGVVQSILRYSFPVIIVDDGNSAEDKELIAKAAAFPLCSVVSLARNSGKGGAVIAGVRMAYEMGLTHVLQIDADGQHDASAADTFFKAAEKHPDAVICGYPKYDKSVPAVRKGGRKFGNAWARIVSLDFSIKDSMCGFRVYPVELFCAIVQRARVDHHMAFDLEILVRFSWSGVPILSMGVNVVYPKDWFSNFRTVEDNVYISWMFIRLCCGMFIRLPFLLARKLREKSKESSLV